MRSDGVSVLMVRAVAAAVERAGVPRGELLRAARLAPERLDELDTRLSLAEYDRLTRAALEVSGDPALGLRLGLESNIGAFDLVGHVSEHSATMRDSIDAAKRYSRLLSEQPEVTLIEQDEVASLRYGFPPGDAPILRMAAELAVAGGVRILRECAGPDAMPLGAYFAYAAPPHRAAYERVLGANVRFEHAFTGIDFPRAWLELPMPHANARLHAVLEAQAQLALEHLDEGAELGSRVQAHLATIDPQRSPTMEEVAQHFGISARSLRRRLAKEGVDYPALLDGARASVARTLLRQPQSTIQEVAYAMGFATPAAFHRAFKRWTGQTPGQYRERR